MAHLITYNRVGFNGFSRRFTETTNLSPVDFLIKKMKATREDGSSYDLLFSLQISSSEKAAYDAEAQRLQQRIDAIVRLEDKERKEAAAQKEAARKHEEALRRVEEIKKRLAEKKASTKSKKAEA